MLLALFGAQAFLAPETVLAVAGSWTQSTQPDFQSGTLSNLAYNQTQHGLVLASGGSLALMGAPAINRTVLVGFAGGFTWIMGVAGEGAPGVGRIIGYSFFTNYVGGTFKLKVFRDNGTHYLFIGQSLAYSSVAKGYIHIDLGGSPIAVQRGDLLGFSLPAGNVGLVEDNVPSSPGCSVYQTGEISSTYPKSSWTCFGPLIPSVQADILANVNGTLTSSIRNTGGQSTWNAVTWHGSIPTGTSLSVSTRTSNDSYSWSPWASASNNTAPPSPPGRFIQYQAGLGALGTITPIFKDVTITYNTTPPASPTILEPSTIISLSILVAGLAALAAASRRMKQLPLN